MRHATLRQLAIFTAVADRMSFSRAAEDLHLTQPAVSAQIKALEGHAGLPLFERVGRKLQLTAAGGELLGYARRIAELFREADEAIERANADLDDTIRQLGELGLGLAREPGPGGVDVVEGRTRPRAMSVMVATTQRSLPPRE